LEEHRRELEQMQQKGRAELAGLKERHQVEVQRRAAEYEATLTELRLQLDSSRAETERLKRANVDLEADRNQIRQSLKQMLELQMKEALTLLGINKSNIDNNLQSISSFTAKSQEQKNQQPQAIEDMDPKLAMLNYDQSIDQLISQVQLNAKQATHLPTTTDTVTRYG
jgi:AAA15 family ATPase/GTPase